MKNFTKSLMILLAFGTTPTTNAEPNYERILNVTTQRTGGTETKKTKQLKQMLTKPAQTKLLVKKLAPQNLIKIEENVSQKLEVIQSMIQTTATNQLTKNQQSTLKNIVNNANILANAIKNGTVTQTMLTQAVDFNKSIIKNLQNTNESTFSFLSKLAVAKGMNRNDLIHVFSTINGNLTTLIGQSNLQKLPAITYEQGKELQPESVTEKKEESIKKQQLLNEIQTLLKNLESFVNEYEKIVATRKNQIATQPTKLNSIEKTFEEIQALAKKIEETNLKIEELIEELTKLLGNSTEDKSQHESLNSLEKTQLSLIDKFNSQGAIVSKQNQTIETLQKKLSEQEKNEQKDKLQARLADPIYKAQLLFDAMNKVYAFVAKQLPSLDKNIDTTKAKNWFNENSRLDLNYFKPKDQKVTCPPKKNELSKTFKQFQHIINVLSGNTKAAASEKELKTTFATTMKEIQKKSNDQLLPLLKEAMKQYNNCYPEQK